MNILSQYERAVSAQKKQALSLCTTLADEMKVKIYLVGGIVRDILLNRAFNDIDILVEDDAILFAKLLETHCRNKVEIIAINEKFKTAKLKFNIGNKNFEADVASTRSEVYEYPCALPILAETGVSLKKDIARRDFTVNALAMSLNKSDFAEIYDETGMGLSDLDNDLIRILHVDSFMDDPSRIVRALKYRTKLNFIMEEDTFALQNDSLNSNKYSDDCQERIKKEVIETLNLFNPTCFDKFVSENIFKLIISQTSKKDIPSGTLFCEILDANIDYIDRSNIWLIFLCLLFAFAPVELVNQNTEKLALRKKEQAILTDFFVLRTNINELAGLKENYDIYKFLEQYEPEAVVANLCLLKDADSSEKIYKYFHKLKNIKLSVTGLDIKSFGIENGAIYKEILSKTLQVKMNNNLTDAEEKQLFADICNVMKD